MSDLQKAIEAISRGDIAAASRRASEAFKLFGEQVQAANDQYREHMRSLDERG